MESGKRFTSIDEYIATFPAEIQQLLQTMRQTIRAEAPEATERIAYMMPTFFQHGNLVHFAALKRHIGFYPTSSGVAAFERELGPYASTKGAIQFPMDQPLPLDLVRRITRYRVRENEERAAAKAPKRARPGAASPSAPPAGPPHR